MADIIIRFERKHEHPTTLSADDACRGALLLIEAICNSGLCDGDRITVEVLSGLPESSRSSHYSP
jgi:hypothetical protein